MANSLSSILKIPAEISSAAAGRLRAVFGNAAQFVIVCHPRTGSQWLGNLLQSHANCQVIDFSESFKSVEIFNLKEHSPELRAAIIKDPAGFVQKNIYQQRCRKDVKAVGFKLFYHHAGRGNPAGSSDYETGLFERYGNERLLAKQRDCEAFLAGQQGGRQTLENRLKGVWDYLERSRSIKIIHLKRANPLDTLLSFHAAVSTGKWQTQKGGAQTVAAPRLEVEECRRFFEQLKRWETETVHFFKDHELIDVLYEDLRAEPDKTLARLLEFLDLPAARLQSDWKKVLKTDATAIANYAELKEAFAGTEWAACFS